MERRMQTNGSGSKKFKDTEAYNAVRNMARKFSDKEYEEIDDIRKDLESLKDNVVALTRHLKKDGAEKAETVKDELIHGLGTLREKGDETLEQLDDKVKQNPRASIAIAFAAGIIANFLLRR